jgi:dehydrogenase/reductase SDR family protein 7B
MNQSFKNQIVWITGASSGIGEALVYAFAKRGSKIVLSARNKTELERVQKEAGLSDENSLVLPLDLEKKEFQSETSAVLKKFGGIDIVIHNGGISQRSLTQDTKFSVFEKIMATNYLGAVALTLATLPHFQAKKSGKYVVVTSIVGKVGTPLRSGYSASKHALHGFFDALRAEVSKDQIKVLVVLPGYIKTKISINALTGTGSIQGKMDQAQEQGILPDVCAEKILSAILSDRQEISIAAFREKLALLLKRFFPKLLAKILEKAKVT